MAIAAIYVQFSEVMKARGVLPPRLERLAPAPDFSFTAQDGSTVKKEDLKGKVWVANFIFTRCAGPCPMMTARMGELDLSLGSKARDVQLVSFTVDPEYDTPEVLKAYSERIGAKPEKWKFLTGSKAQIDETVMKGFLQALSKDQAGMPIHSTRFVLVDKDGWIRGFQDGNDPEIVQKLMMDIGDVLREPSGKAP